MSETGLQHSLEKMRADGLADAAIDTFRHYYELLEAGETGMMPEADLDPVESFPRFEDLPDDAVATELLDQAVVIKLNGGLGTSMGMTGPKSLLPVKDGLTFLDVTARQVLALRRASGARLPLLLMHSFATQEASLDALQAYDDLEVDVPLDFLQNREPKLRADDLEPVQWPPDPALEWCPPGHGDLYPALVGSGTLERLLDEGYRYAFVSNVDNLGATFEPRILAWFAGSGAPFASESVDRTPADKKGGHLAVRKADGQLVLRETAQVPEDDQASFMDTDRHRFFNANNLWIDLRALSEVMRARGSVLGLPMIVNRKTVDPGDKASPEVLQIETAMGSAIGVFEGAVALHVPRERFVPVKTTSDLLLLRSDVYALSDDARLSLAAGLSGAPLVDLSDAYKLVRDFDERFPDGPPSLVEATSLTVSGDAVFGADVVVRGDVTVDGDEEIEDGTILAG